MFKLYVIFNPNQTGLFDSSRTIFLKENCPPDNCLLDDCPPDNCPRGKLPSRKIVSSP